MERKIKILIEYDGSAYHGWQFQTNGITIQEVLQNCIYKVVKKKTILHSSGRTDAGVHAEGMVAHFVTTSKMTEGEFIRAFNSFLPHDIVVKDVESHPSISSFISKVPFHSISVKYSCDAAGSKVFGGQTRLYFL